MPRLGIFSVYMQAGMNIRVFPVMLDEMISGSLGVPGHRFCVSFSAAFHRFFQQLLCLFLMVFLRLAHCGASKKTGKTCQKDEAGNIFFHWIPMK